MAHIMRAGEIPMYYLSDNYNISVRGSWQAVSQSPETNCMTCLSFRVLTAAERAEV